MNNNNLTIDSIINMLKTYINLTDYTLITKSFNYVKNYIDDLNTLNDYLEIASILTTVYADMETISASFLYHLLVLEKVSETSLKEEFSSEVVSLSMGAYKLDEIIYSTENDYLVE